MQYVLVVGYGWSGSSAVVDLLNEFECFHEAKVEFRVIKDPYGIDDLYNQIVSNWDPLNSDIAIKDFIWHMRHLNLPDKKLSLERGLDYSRFFEGRFWDATKRFVSKITDFKYEGYWWFFDFKKNKSEILKDKIKHAVFNKREEDDRMFFTHPSREKFLKCSRDYMNDLFSPWSQKKDNDYILLDQAVAAQKCEIQRQYFDNPKIIVVDRDPRDIYIDLIDWQKLIGRELYKRRDANKYVEWHKALRKNINIIKDDSDILYLNFEDLVLSYDSALARITDFLHIDCSMHTNKKKYFDPAFSKKNVGIWEGRLDSNEQKIFASRLGEYLIDERH